MNQVSCFFPENENTLSVSLRSPAVRPREPLARLPPVSPPRTRSREVPAQPLLLPLPRVRRSGWSLRTRVEHAVRTAAWRGLDQLRDGERELLQHRQQRGCRAREARPEQQPSCLQEQGGKERCPGTAPSSSPAFTAQPQSRTEWQGRKGSRLYLPHTHSADTFQGPRTSRSNRRLRARPGQQVRPVPQPGEPRGGQAGGMHAAPQPPLTIKPSLFFPPRIYRLPSLGSGRNAGLERREEDETGAAPCPGYRPRAKEELH